MVPLFYSSNDWFKIARGWVASVELEHAAPRDEVARQLINQTVFIDGKEFKVLGVEGFATKQPLRTFGLLVNGEPPTDEEIENYRWTDG